MGLTRVHDLARGDTDEWIEFFEDHQRRVLRLPVKRTSQTDERVTFGPETAAKFQVIEISPALQLRNEPLFTRSAILQR